MKLSALAVIAAGAAFVSASPLRVVVVSSTNAEHPVDFPGAVRFGHAVPEIPRPVFGFVPSGLTPEENRPQRKKPCMGAMFRQKAVKASNSFRKFFGFPAIEPEPEKFVEIKPAAFTSKVGRPTFIHVDGEMAHGNGWRGRTKGGDRIEIIQAPHQYGHGRPRFHHIHHEQDFFVRVQNAIMSLGPWEGRAVAFVLGCGLGVLLRMFFVLAVVLVRALRGSDEQPEYEEVLVFEVDENDSRRSPPPAYIYPVDEKVAVKAPAEVESAQV